MFVVVGSKDLDPIRKTLVYIIIHFLNYLDAGRTNLMPETAKKKFVRAMEVLPDALSHATQPKL